MSQAQKYVQKAIEESGYLADGEIVVGWVLVVEVAGQDREVRLMHRAGGGADGEDAPALWDALGMLGATKLLVEDDITSGGGRE